METDVAQDIAQDVAQDAVPIAAPVGGAMGKMPFQTEYPPPAWCRNLMRLASDLDGVEGVFIGLKEEDRWITFAAGAERLSTEELVRACELAARREGPEHSDGNGENPPTDPPFTGVRLRDPEGQTIGALVVLAARGEEIDPATGRVLTELATLIAPLTNLPRARKDTSSPQSSAADPALLVRVLGRIQPLISEITAFSEVLQREVIGTSRKRAELIHRNGSDVIRTLRSVLDLIDLESTASEVDVVDADFATVAREELERHRPQIRKRGLRLHFSEPEEPLPTRMDVRALRRIIGVFLSNAVTFTAEGNITVEVTRTSTHDQVAVRDTGPGMAPEFVSKVFQPFAAERNEQREERQGAGLGLAIAKSLADRAGLELVAKSRLGEGSTFIVRCPRDMEVDEENDSGHHNVENVRIEVANRPLVLLVEDNAVTRRVIEMMVRGEYDIVAASTVDEALECAREYQFDLLLLDVSLNERRTGVEVLHGMRRMIRYQNVPAVACTANTRPGIRERILDAGFDGYIGKPFRAQQLLETMAEALEQGRRKTAMYALEGDVEIELLPVPSTLPRLLRVVSNEDGEGDPHEVRRILEADPAASSYVLSHVNSAYFSVRGQVGTVERAITLLGAETLSNLVISGLLAKTLESLASEEVRRVHGHIVRLSLATAGYAKILAERLEMKNPELTFAAGLLHDTGRLCMLAHDPEEYAALWLQDDGSLRQPEMGQELLHFDVDHVRVGAQLSRKWELPDPLAAVVSLFEQPDRALSKHRDFVSVVTAGRAAAIRLIMNDEQTAHLGSALRRLEMLHSVPPGELRTLIDERRDEVKSLLESMRTTG